MLPPPLYPNPGSYDDVLKRMTRRIKQQKVDQQIFHILLQVYEKELQHGVILSRPERTRLFQQVSRQILADVLGKIDRAK